MSTQHPADLPPLDYVLLHEFSEQNHVDYNKLCATVRAALAQAQPSLTDERAAFEKVIAKDCGDLSTFGTGANMHYKNSYVESTWEGWKARAALATQAAQPEHEDTRLLDFLDDMGGGWFARMSSTGRGFRLHQDGEKIGQTVRDALREALGLDLDDKADQPEQPAQTYPACKGRNCGATDGRSHSPECIAEHDQAAQPVQAQGVPEGWSLVEKSSHILMVWPMTQAQLLAIGIAAAPQQAAPQQAEPLSDAQIDALAGPFIQEIGGDHWNDGDPGIPDDGDIALFARAIEAAHGIGTKEPKP